MARKVRLEIINPECTVYAADITMVIARATTGELGILAGHAPLIARLAARPVRILQEEGELEVAIKGGIMQVGPGQITILTPS